MSAAEAAELMRSGALSARKVTAFFLERIRERNEHIRAFITVDEAGAMKCAEALDACPVEKRKGRLFGVPVSVKDNILTRGLRTTAGSAFLQDFIPPDDAEAVARIRKEGAVILGKTNLDEFGMGSATRNPVFGNTVNPLDDQRSPGGSSGGAAASVSGGMCMLALGTDTGGSVRQPAAYCGLYGIKPTYGAVSRYGLIAYASSMDQIGVIGKYPEDLRLALSVISGRDEKDDTSLPVPEDCLDQAELSGLRIGIPMEFLKEEISDENRRAVSDFADFLKGEGAEAGLFHLMDTSLFIPVYYLLACSEASSNLGRYDGIRYGKDQAVSENLGGLYRENRTSGFSGEVRTRILTGTYMLSEENYEDLYLKAEKARKLIRNAYDQAFQSYDLLLTPCVPGEAPLLTGPSVYSDDLFTVGANLAGLPAIALPLGKASVQLTGPRMKEGKLLSAAFCYEKKRREKEMRWLG